MPRARRITPLMMALHVTHEEYETMRSDYNTNSPQADHMSFEQYWESEIETSRRMRARRDVLGRGRDPGPGDSEPRSREAGHACHGPSFVSRPAPREEAARFDQNRKLVSCPGPRESGHRNQEVGRSSHDRSFVSHPHPREEARRSTHEPYPRESEHRSQEAGHSNHDRFPISRPRPREEYTHHATTPSPSSRARRGTGCPDCEDMLDDDFYDEAYSDNESLAVNTGISTSRIPIDRTLRGHRSDRSRATDSLAHRCGTDSPYQSDSPDDHVDDNYDDDLPREAIRPTTRHGPISRRAQSPPSSPPPRSVQSPPPFHPDHFYPRADRLPPPLPSPFALGSPAQSLPSTHDSQARSGAGYDVSQYRTPREPLMANGTHLRETGYDARGGPSPGNGRGGGLRYCQAGGSKRDDRSIAGG